MTRQVGDDASCYFRKDAFIIIWVFPVVIFGSWASVVMEDVLPKARGEVDVQILRVLVNFLLFDWFRCDLEIFLISCFQLPKATRWHRIRVITYSMWSRRFTPHRRTVGRHKCKLRLLYRIQDLLSAGKQAILTKFVINLRCFLLFSHQSGTSY